MIREFPHFSRFSQQNHKIETEEVASRVPIKINISCVNLRLDGYIFCRGTKECVISISEAEMSVLQGFWTLRNFHFNSRL